MSRPSLAAMQVIATQDAMLFEHVMADMGLPILGIRNSDPLDKQSQMEAISGFADSMSEDINEKLDLEPELQAYYNMANALGYIVGINAPNLSN